MKRGRSYVSSSFIVEFLALTLLSTGCAKYHCVCVCKKIKTYKVNQTGEFYLSDYNHRR